MRKTPALILTVALFAVLAATALAATRSVTVGDDFFVRSSGVPTVTVRKNDTVKWLFRGDNTHNVVVSKGPVKFRSSQKSSGSYSRRMTKAGTYTIYCSLHGAEEQSMKLVVK
jgi:plastocyanin